jgi:hypothetical protein
MEKMKVAIITWLKYFNLGTLLQAFALQYVIRNLGYDCVTLWDGNINLPPKRNFLREQLSFIKRVLFNVKDYKFYKNNRIFEKKCSSFIAEKIDVHKVASEKNLNLLDSIYDVFVCGSDQIWAPYNPDFYFASFSHKKKISYAPSIGRIEITSNEKQQLKERVSNFSHISIREKTGQAILKEVTQRNDISVVADPTLLISASEWRQCFLKKKKTDGGFIFVYFLSANRTYFDYVKKISKKTNKKIICVHSIPECKSLTNELVSCSPQEFLNFIDSASLVITDSFHCTVFSLLFETRFITVKRFKENDWQSQNTRLTNLFETIRCEDCFYDESKVNGAVPFTSFDQANKFLSDYRNESLSFLKNALES